MRYDAAVLADLKSTEADLKKEMSAIATRMHERRDGKDSWSVEDSSQHAADTADHTVAKQRLDLVRADIHVMEQIRPLTKEQREAPLRRFLSGGLKKLGETDAKMFGVQAKGESLAWIPEMSGGELFYIPQDKELMRAAFGNERMPVAKQMAVATDGTAGANIAPTGIMDPIDTLTYVGSGMDAFARFNTANGGPMRVPQFDTAGTRGTILGSQGSTVSDSDVPNPTNVEFVARTGTSGFISLPMESVPDSGFDLVGWAYRQVDRRLVKAWNNALTNNAHDGNPQGAVGTATTFRTHTAAYSAGTAFGANSGAAINNLIDLKHSVDRAYRSPMGEGVGAGFVLNGQGMRGWMIADGIEAELEKLKDSDNRPLLLPSIREGVPPTLLGYPLLVNGDMPDPAAGVVLAAFGNFASFGMRVVGGVAVYRFFDSSTASTYETKIVGFNRMDGRVRLPLSSNRNPAIQTFNAMA